VFDDRKSLVEALTSCREFSTKLVKIESQNETEFIDATFHSTRKKIWIGLTDVQKKECGNGPMALVYGDIVIGD